MIGPWPDRAAYGRYLAGQRQFRSGVEALEFCGHGLSWPMETLGEAIDADCRDLGLASAIPDDSFADPSDTSEALGMLYVVEGAALGARLLVGRADALGLTASFGARHLAIQARGVTRWRDFLDRLETAAPFDLDRAAGAAMRTFAFAATAFGSRAHA